MGDMSHGKADAKKASCLPILNEMGSASAYGKWEEWTRMSNEGWEDNEDSRELSFRGIVLAGLFRGRNTGCCI